MATSGSEWADIVAKYNSGTYNNQYMVVDLKLFTPGQELRPNLLWVVEQVMMLCRYSTCYLFLGSMQTQHLLDTIALLIECIECPVQIPGLTVAEDQTEILSRGYWPSYNVPFYPEIYR